MNESKLGARLAIRRDGDFVLGENARPVYG